MANKISQEELKKIIDDYANIGVKHEAKDEEESVKKVDYQKKKNTNYNILFILFIISLIGNAVLFYMYTTLDSNSVSKKEYEEMQEYYIDLINESDEY